MSKTTKLLFYNPKLIDLFFYSQVQDEKKTCWLYTLDKGATKFYDLLQLIEFYQLNSGSLPTRLTHYVQNGVTSQATANATTTTNTTSSKTTPSRKDENSSGASPSPPSSGNQNMSPKTPKSSSGI